MAKRGITKDMGIPTYPCPFAEKRKWVKIIHSPNKKLGIKSFSYPPQIEKIREESHPYRDFYHPYQ